MADFPIPAWVQTVEDEELYGEAIALGARNEGALGSKAIASGFVRRKSGGGGGMNNSQFEKLTHSLDVQEQRLNGLFLGQHMIQSSIPTVVSFPILSPSKATVLKDVTYGDYLTALDMAIPQLSQDVFSSETIHFEYTWDWEGKSENLSYAPLCEALRKALLLAVNVSNGQHLYNSNLFNQAIFSARRTDLTGARNDTVYKGRVCGKTDIVILNRTVDESSDYFITRNMVKFAIEIKTPDGLTPNSAALSGAIREACTQVLGLSADNSTNTPSVILTDLCLQFFVAYLISPHQYKYEIKVQRCLNLVSALEFADATSRNCVSTYFARPWTPPTSDASS